MDLSIESCDEYRKINFIRVEKKNNIDDKYINIANIKLEKKECISHKVFLNKINNGYSSFILSDYLNEEECYFRFVITQFDSQEVIQIHFNFSKNIDWIKYDIGCK